jgi:hypothetical protein
LSRGIELSLARPCPAAWLAMYAQIMVKMRHRGLASNPCISRRPAEKVSGTRHSMRIRHAILVFK